MGRSNSGVSGDSLTESVDLTMNNSDNNRLYVEGEKVLAFHGGKWYEAKVRKAEYEAEIEAWTYWIHYIGWNRRHDEWVKAELLKKFKEEDSQNQSGDQCGRSGSKDKQEKSERIYKENPSVRKKNLLNLEIPPKLKKQLLGDMKNVTHLGKLVGLPRSPNVDDILKMFYELRVKENEEIRETTEQIVGGLLCYFDKALSPKLLYKSERNQYDEVSAMHVPPSTIYGAEHFLRLFVKLPEILQAANIEEEAVLKLHSEILGLLKFLEINQSTFFLSSY